MNNDFFSSVNDLCAEFERTWSPNHGLTEIPRFVGGAPQSERVMLAKRLIEIDLDLRKRAELTGPASEDYMEALKAFPSIHDEVLRGVFNSPHRVARQRRQIGAYKLLQQIGEGGMGTVWMAQQGHPVRRRVAIKLVRADRGTEEVIARFEAERQALAMMDHPNIAKVLDAGNSKQGEPFFVMELVKGIPITEYCDQKRLGIRDRLELFIPVCRAIQHAHQKSIIHRDLKPSNVLVTHYDGQPVAKVIDFGLAKALEHTTQLTDKTLFTEFGKVVGTLQYMSPEQAEMNALDVDTRTDVYSLGVMLYELLTGSTPLDGETLKQKALLQVLQIIREEEPPVPSARISSSTKTHVSISEQRQIEPAKLQQILRGELDWVVMKALEKDRARRIQTAKDLGDEIQRYLEDEPVLSRPPSTSYRISKFAKKHRGLVRSYVAVVALLTVGLLTTGSMWRMAAVQAKKAGVSRNDAQQLSRKAGHTIDRAKKDLAKAIEIHQQKDRNLSLTNTLAAEARWSESRVGEAIEFLEKVPERFRSVEWYLALRKYQGSFGVFRGHTSTVTSVSFSRDSRWLASTEASVVRIWNLDEGKPVADAGGTCATFGPLGRWLAVGVNGAIEFYDVTAIQQQRRPSYVISCGEESAVPFQLSWSTDGSKIAVACRESDNANLMLLDTANQRVIKKWNHPSLRSVALRPDGKSLVSGGEDGTIRIHHLSAESEALPGFETVKSTDGKNAINAVGYSPDGKYLVTTCHNKITNVWSASGELKYPLSGNRNWGHCLAFSPNGEQMATGSGKTITLWNCATGRRISEFRGHTESVRAVAFSADGTKLASGSLDRTVRLWDVESNSVFRTVNEHANVNSVALAHDATKLVSAAGREVHVWDPQELNRLEFSWSHQDVVNSVGISQQGKIASAGDDGIVNIMDSTDTATEKVTLDHKERWGNTAKVQDIAFTRNGKLLVSVGTDASPAIWSSSGKFKVSAEKPTTQTSEEINCVCISPDDKVIVAGTTNGRVHVWELNATDETIEAPLIHTIENHEGNNQNRNPNGHAPRDIYAVAFNPYGHTFATGARDDTIKVWKFDRTNRRVNQTPVTFWSHAGDVYSLAFVESRKNRGVVRLVSGSGDGSIKILDPDQGHELASLQGHGLQVLGLSTAQSMLASCSADGRITLWEWDFDPSKTKILRGHQTFVDTVGFAQDGSIFSTDASGLTHRWELVGESWESREVDSVPNALQPVMSNEAIMVHASGRDVVLADLDKESNESSRRLYRFFTRPRSATSEHDEHD